MAENVDRGPKPDGYDGLLRLEKWAKRALVVHALVLVGFYFHDYSGIFRMPFSLYLLSSTIFLFDVIVLAVKYLWMAGCRLLGQTHSSGCRPGGKGRRRIALALLWGTLLLFLQPSFFCFSEDVRQQPIFYYDRGRYTPNVLIHRSPLLKVTSVVELSDYTECRYDCALPSLAKVLAQWERGSLPAAEWGFEESWGGPGYGTLVIREDSAVVSIHIPFREEDLPRVKAMTGLGQ